MPDIILKGSEVTANSAPSTIGEAKRVRVYASSGNAVLTLEDPIANTTLGTITIPNGTTITLQKKATDTIATDVDTLCVSIGYGI